MSAKRELIDTGTDKRYVRRGDDGRFSESDDVGKSAASKVLKSGSTGKDSKTAAGSALSQKPYKKKS